MAEISRDHRAFVGPPDRFDLATASQFNLLTAMGLRETHTLLDIGCGSLRAGRLFIPYLLPNRYFGMEPEQWLIDKAIESEIGHDLAKIKQPAFSNDTNFTLTTFGRKFDFMLAQSIFSHATQKQIKRCLSEAKKSLEPAGIFMATFFVGDSNYEGDEWVYPGKVFYTMEYFSSMCAENGLKCQKVNWTHTNDQTWVAICHSDAQIELPEVFDAGRIKVMEHRLQTAQDKLKAIESLMGFRWIKRINKALGKKIK